MRWMWDFSFVAGSLVATFVQGMTVGALVEGLPITNGEYSGGEFGWFSPFAVLCGIGLCFGYTLLGACWLIKKCDGEVKAAAYRQVPYLATRTAGLPRCRFLFCAGRKSPDHERWLERPYLFIFPAIAIVAAIVLAAQR